jgi:hypothetical protein
VDVHFTSEQEAQLSQIECCGRKNAHPLDAAASRNLAGENTYSTRGFIGGR